MSKNFGQKLSDLPLGEIWSLLYRWRFGLFVFFLGMLMIYASNSADQKVYRISSLNERQRELSAQFVELRTKLMHMRMETELLEQLKDAGFERSTEPPVKIVIED